MKVIVKAWFDHRAFIATVIGESNGKLLVAPERGAAVWRNPDDCIPIG